MVCLLAIVAAGARTVRGSVGSMPDPSRAVGVGSAGDVVTLLAVVPKRLRGGLAGAAAGIPRGPHAAPIRGAVWPTFRLGVVGVGGVPAHASPRLPTALPDDGGQAVR